MELILSWMMDEALGTGELEIPWPFSVQLSLLRWACK
jgi:hypothetical protein